jgi:hypothetical protein
MQFNEVDWFSKPFIYTNSSEYRRNLLQERFIHLYSKYDKNIKDKIAETGVSTSECHFEKSKPFEPYFEAECGSYESNISSLTLNEQHPSRDSLVEKPVNVLSHSTDSGTDVDSEDGVIFSTEEQIDQEVILQMKRMRMTYYEKENNSTRNYSCAPCRRILSVGPTDLDDDSVWQSGINVRFF